MSLDTGSALLEAALQFAGEVPGIFGGLDDLIQGVQTHVL